MTVSQVPLPGSASACIGLAVLGVVVSDAGWRVVRHVTVMAHEGAHAVTGTLLSGKLGGITLNSDATGATEIRTPGAASDLVMTFSGYAGPSLSGLGAAKLIELGHIVAVLWVTLFLLALLLLVLRRSFGRVSVVITGALVYLAGHDLAGPAQIIVAYAIAWLLLLSGVRRILEVGALSGDGANMSRLTYIPRAVWFLLWLAATLGAVAVGGKMLVMPA